MMQTLSLPKELIRRRDVKTLVRGWFNFNLTYTQELIVRTIAFREHNRINISAMTRYGKSKCVTLGLLIYIILNKDQKIVFIGPTIDQALILRSYMTEGILQCADLQDIIELTATGLQALKKEASRKRQTFKNGMEYAIFSVEGDANRVMGIGGDVIVREEDALISREADIKIIRMLGDNPENGMQINLMNPWDVDTTAYDDWTSPDFFNIHVSWQVALKEGRTTQAFIDEMRRRNPPLAFTVLYDSKFPGKGEDSIFDMEWIDKCMKNNFSLWDDYQKLKKQYNAVANVNPVNASQLLKKLGNYKFIISDDPADKGLDLTVDWWGINYGNQYQIVGEYDEAVSDNMAISSQLFKISDDNGGATHLHIDSLGLGTGVVSRSRQIKKERGQNIVIKECSFGANALDEKVFDSAKSENYFRLRDIIKEGRIDLPGLDDSVMGGAARKLRSELMKMKWDQFGTRKRTRIIDPEKSPDFADALVYFVWKDKREFSYSFLEGM